MLNHLVRLYQSIGKSSLFLLCSTITGQFAGIVQYVITSTSHILVVPLTLMTLLLLLLF